MQASAHRSGYARLPAILSSAGDGRKAAPTSTRKERGCDFRQDWRPTSASQSSRVGATVNARTCRRERSELAALLFGDGSRRLRWSLAGYAAGATFTSKARVSASVS